MSSDANWKAARLDVKSGSTPEQTADAVRKVLDQFTFSKWEDGPTAAANAIKAEDRHSPESIVSVIATLQSLAETLPAALTVANGWAPADIKFTNRDAMHSAVDMLRKYLGVRRSEIAEREKNRKESEFHDLMATLERVREEGRVLGIEQARAECRDLASSAKEARKGRKRGAKKS